MLGEAKCIDCVTLGVLACRIDASVRLLPGCLPDSSNQELGDLFMARIISITSPVETTDAILQELKPKKGVLELQVYRNASVSPPGDVIKVALPNAHLNEVMRLLDKYNIGREDGISITTSEPNGIVPIQSSREIKRDNNEATWEEMELTISDDSNATPNTLITMAISGALAAVGIATNALHIVVGGMLIAPGFMPITRVALGFIGRQQDTWRYGIYDFLKGYFALILGAIAMTALLKMIGHNPLPGSISYYVANKSLMEYWTTISSPAVLTSLVASIAGGLLVASKKSVLASGVMIGLALVPSAALVGMGLIAGDFAIALKAVLRFAVEVVLVFAMSFMVFLCSRIYLHRRDMSS